MHFSCENETKIVKITHSGQGGGRPETIKWVDISQVGHCIVMWRQAVVCLFHSSNVNKGSHLKKNSYSCHQTGAWSNHLILVNYNMFSSLEQRNLISLLC